MAKRFKAERAKRKVNPLVEQGHKVSIEYTNTRAFESRQITKVYGENTDNPVTRTYTRDRLPSNELLTWMNEFCGPLGVLWITEKNDTGLDVYFAVAAHAMMFKLTWAGS